MPPKAKAQYEFDGPTAGAGTFYYPTATRGQYTGSWKVNLPSEAAAPVDGQPSKPTRVRHGKGVQVDGAARFGPATALVQRLQPAQRAHTSQRSWEAATAARGEGTRHMHATCPPHLAPFHSNSSSGDYSYEGDFCEDAMEGQGTFKFASGASYSGGWQGNKYHGKGTFTWPDGRRYEGDFEHGVMHGQGAYKDAQGRVWSGQFFQGAGPGLTFDLP